MPKPSGKKPAAKTCFVIAPIGNHGTRSRTKSDRVFKEVIQPAMKACGYTAVRGDMIEEDGLITKQIFQHLFEDPLVIADLTGSNPNVFYELAICHALRRPLLHLIEEGSKMQFDVADVRAIRYSLENAETISAAKRAVIRRVGELEMRDPYLDTPVSAAIDSQLLVTKTPDLGQEFDRAEEVWLAGVSLASTVGKHRKALERNIKRGLKLRALIANPHASVITPAVRRKSGLRSVEAGLKKKKAEINLSLSLLQSLQKEAPGTVTVLRTAYPLAYGATVVDPEERHGVVHIRFYTYGVDKEKPALTLRAGAPWYRQVVQELEALWTDGRELQDLGEKERRVFE